MAGINLVGYCSLTKRGMSALLHLEALLNPGIVASLDAMNDHLNGR